MAAQQGMPGSALRVLEEALGMGLPDAGDTADAVAAEGAYYLEQVTITEASEDDYEYEEIPDDNFSIPEGEEDLAKAIQMVQEQAADTHILIKGILKGRHFDDIQDIKGNPMTALKAIPEKEFQNCIEGWTRHWCQCIASQGEYFKGDHSDIQQ